MQDDTRIGGPHQGFPATRVSIIEKARSDDGQVRRRAFEMLIAAYWKPIYKYIRIRWNKSNEDGKDLTQEFFARVMEKEFLGSYDPAKSRLRTFLRMCADRFIANEEKASHRLKRGGGDIMVTLDFESADGELKRIEPPAPDTFEDFFEKEFVRSLFMLAVDQLRSECEAKGKTKQFRIFELYDLEDHTQRPSYEELARTFNVAVTDITNHLAWARREFRRIALEKLREMSGSEEEFRGEARSLLGVES